MNIEIFNFIIILYIGVLFIYICNKPLNIILKYNN